MEKVDLAGILENLTVIAKELDPAGEEKAEVDGWMAFLEPFTTQGYEVSIRFEPGKMSTFGRRSPEATDSTWSASR